MLTMMIFVRKLGNLHKLDLKEELLVTPRYFLLVSHKFHLLIKYRNTFKTTFLTTITMLRTQLYLETWLAPHNPAWWTEVRVSK